MQTLTYDGTFNLPLLAQEIAQKLPTIAFDRDDDGYVDLRFDVDKTPTGIIVRVSNDVEEGMFRTTIIETHDPTQKTEQQVFRSKIIAIAQTAVGVKLIDLTAAQIKALMACLLYDVGGVDPKTMAVNPLEGWLL